MIYTFFPLKLGEKRSMSVSTNAMSESTAGQDNLSTQATSTHSGEIQANLTRSPRLWL